MQKLNAKETSSLTILDPLGCEIASRNLGKVYEGQEIFGTRKLSNGIYFFQLYQDGQMVSDGKFIVTH